MTKILNHWTICLLFQVSWLKRDISTKGVPALLTFGNTVYISDARFSIQRHTDDWVKRCFKWSCVSNDVFLKVRFVPNEVLVQMTFCFKWRFVSNDVLFQMTFCFKWRFVSNYVLFQVTFCFKWRFVSNDVLFQMTFRFKQRFWKTFCFKRLFKKTFSIDVFVSFFTFQKPIKICYWVTEIPWFLTKIRSVKLKSLPWILGPHVRFYVPIY